MNDLLQAQASIDWAVANLPAFKERLDLWQMANISVGVKELDDNTPNNIVVAVEKEPLPLAFTVEAGAYINAIRSSLDILTTILAARHNISSGIEPYFPVTNSAADFASGNYKGKEFIERLPLAERSIIESLEPYQGGNPSLWALHKLDITRKHCKLLTVDTSPAMICVFGFGITPIATGHLRVNNETVLALIAKGSPKPDVQYSSCVVVDEIDFIARKPILAALDEFARTATSIIELFA